MKPFASGKHVWIAAAVSVAPEQTTLTTGARATYVLLPVFGSGGAPESVIVAVFG